MQPLGRFLAVIAFLAFAGAFGFEVWSAEQCRYTQDCAGYRGTHQEPSEQGLTPEEQLALYTRWLALFTGALAIASTWQGVFLIRADRTARTAADAALRTAKTASAQAAHLGNSVEEAKRAATAMENVAGAMNGTLKETTRIADEEFVASHAPKIRVKHVWLSGEIWEGEQIKIQIMVTNVGKTIALVDALKLITFMHESDRELPIPPELPDLLEFFPKPSPHVLHSGVTLDFHPQPADRKLTDADNVALRERTKRLYCVGHVDYRDSAGRIRKTAFCRVLQIPKSPRSYQDIGRFVVHRDPDYEYED